MSEFVGSTAVRSRGILSTAWDKKPGNAGTRVFVILRISGARSVNHIVLIRFNGFESPGIGLNKR